MLKRPTKAKRAARSEGTNQGAKRLLDKVIALTQRVRAKLRVVRR
jgi:hypothetical protein